MQDGHFCNLDEVVGLLVDKRIHSFRLTMNFCPSTRFNSSPSKWGIRNERVVWCRATNRQQVHDKSTLYFDWNNKHHVTNSNIRALVVTGRAMTVYSLGSTQTTFGFVLVTKSRDSFSTIQFQLYAFTTQSPVLRPTLLWRIHSQHCDWACTTTIQTTTATPTQQVTSTIYSNDNFDATHNRTQTHHTTNLKLIQSFCIQWWFCLVTWTLQRDCTIHNGTKMSPMEPSTL